MQYEATSSNAARQQSDCVVVGVYDKKVLNSAAAALDKASNGYLEAMARDGDLPSALGNATMLRDLAGVRAPRILIVGLGPRDNFCIKQLDRAAEVAARALLKTGTRNATFYLASNSERFSDAHKVTQTTVGAAHRSLYRFDQLKSKKSTTRPALRKIGLGFSSRKSANQAKQAFKQADAIATGIALTKDLGNLPPNVCTPDYLARTARDIAKAHKNMTVQVLGLAEIKKLGMGAFLSVTQGAVRPPRLIIMRYKGAAAKDAPIALVGKGITFDTGGISLKPPANMDEMKYDMCGAGAVLGAFKSLAMIQPELNAIGIVAACENMPSGDATRPGDIVKTMSGQTVEVLNTDAEGRLILCDALTYTRKFKPKAIVDIATLTGACVIALGDHFSGLMSPNDELAQQLQAAGEKTGDVAWRLPVTQDYVPRLKSNFADFANVGGRPAGTITAACFLWQFMKDQNWAHLDIAGTAWKGGTQKGATGRPVSLLVQYVLDNGPAGK